MKVFLDYQNIMNFHEIDDMWFNYAINKEKIDHIFSGDLPLKNVSLETIIIHDIRSVRIVFSSKDIPKNTPKKWSEHKFDSIRITLEFCDINQLEFKGGAIGLLCSPDIYTSEKKSSLLIRQDNFFFNCESGFLIIKEIEPFLMSVH